jgi:arylsulfatase A-like enzyme
MEVEASRRRGLRRLIPEPSALSQAEVARVGPRQVLGGALWLGLATGPLEVALVLATKPLRDPTPGLFHMNRHILWMIPLFDLLLFLIAGAGLAVLARVRSRFSASRAAFGLLFLSLLCLALAIRSMHPAAAAVLAAGLALRGARRLETTLFGGGRFVRWTAAGLAALVVGLFGLTLGREALAELAVNVRLGTAPSRRPNVLLVVMDTVGAGHMSLYGYDRETTPNLARLARRGVRFDEARSTAPWTLPSHASMFTGRWPHELSASFEGPLDGQAPTLAEYLSGQGYVTAGFIANTLYCSAESGLARGFVHYEDHEVSLASLVHSAAFGQRLLEKCAAPARRLVKRLGGSQVSAAGERPQKPYKDADRVGSDALGWLDRQPARPFFLFLNLYDAHTPYLLPDACGGHFGLAPSGREDYALLNSFWDAGKQKLSPRDLELARDAYDDCIASMDAQLGRFLHELERRNLLRDTLVIVTADHGEQFGEHELYGHAGSLYRPEVHVPLLIVPPGGIDHAQVIPEPVSLRNIPATVADVVGSPGASPFPGSSLAWHWNPGGSRARAPIEDLVLSEVASPATSNANHGRSPVFRGSMSSIVARGSVYIRNGDGGEELYNLANDPAESRNLVADEAYREVLDALRTRLERETGTGPRGGR